MTFSILNANILEHQASATVEYMERYRSGHNEAVLKTVCPQGRVGSNPTLSAFRSFANARLLLLYQLGVNPPADIASGRAHIVRWTMVLRRPKRSVDLQRCAVEVCHAIA